MPDCEADPCLPHPPPTDSALEARISRRSRTQWVHAAHEHEVRRLLLNFDGIRDYVPMIRIHPELGGDSDDRARLPSSGIAVRPGQGLRVLEHERQFARRHAHGGDGRERGCARSRTLRRDRAVGCVTTVMGAMPPATPRGGLHWSCPGYGGGLIGTAADAMRACAWIASQPEFVQMTRWSKPDGSPERAEYRSPSGPRPVRPEGPRGMRTGRVLRWRHRTLCRSSSACVRGRVFYVATTHPVDSNA